VPPDTLNAQTYNVWACN